MFQKMLKLTHKKRNANQNYLGYILFLTYYVAKIQKFGNTLLVRQWRESLSYTAGEV